MPPEPLPWDRKDFFKERKHERSESLGSVARWRDSSHHRDFNRWGSTEFRRPPGHGKQGGWHLFPEDSGHGYAISRSSSDKILEEDSRPSISRGDGKYGRSSRENRAPFGQRDWRGHSWEPSNGTMNLPRRPQDVNNDQRAVDDALAYSSHQHSDFGNSWDQHHLKDQHEKIGGSVNGLGTGPRSDRENSLGDWKPLKWTRSGSLSSRGSGFSHSSSSRSMGAADSHEAKAELQTKSAVANESHSGEAAACATSSVPSEDTASRKKPRLNWGEGLAKYEKKKVEVPEASANKDGPALSASIIEPCNFLSTSLVDKSPKVTGFSECASPATPSSVACSSSPGMDDKLFGKTANVDNDVSNFTCSPAPLLENNLLRFPFNLEKFDIGSLTNLGSSIIELVKSDDPTSVDSGPMRSNAINKLLIWKADISKVLEMTESEIDLLENELRSLKSEYGERCKFPVSLDSQMLGSGEKSCEEHVGVSDQVTRPVPLNVVDDPNMEKVPLSTNLLSIHENVKEEDIDSPGTATSKFVEPLPLIKSLSCGTGGYVSFSRDLDSVPSAAQKCLIPCSARKDVSVSSVDGKASMEVNDSMDILCGTIISSNKECANKASEVFDNLLPKDCCKIGKMETNSDTCNHTLIREKFAEKKRFARFKERVIALKFRALHHLWKEDMRLLSIRKCRPKSHKKNELSVRTTCNGNQKNRSSIRSRFPFPAGNHLSLVPTSEMINFTSKLLTESQVKVQRNTLKMPALILDEKEKTISKFVSSNGLVEDPLAIEKERSMINPWTPQEREVFLEKFAAFGKNFRKIASFLDHKTTADCVEFYYKNHKSDCFEKLKKQDVGKLGKSFSTKTDLVASGKKWNRELNAASLEILSAASLMADGIAGNKKIRAGSSLLGGYGKVKTSRVEDFIEKSGSFDILGDERETAAAADVLAGICGSLSSEAISSCITSSVDPVEGSRDRKFLKVNPLYKLPMTPDVTQDVDDETCSDESCGEMDPTDWTDDERAAFLQAVSSFGKDFAKIARRVGTRSQEQCKVFFSKGRKCLGLDLMRPISENVGSPVNDDANGGESDTDDACVVETGSVVGTEKSGTKTDEDLPLYGTNTFNDESNPVQARNLSAELKESKGTNGTEVDIEDANLVSDACAIDIDSKQGCDGSEFAVCGSVSGQAAVVMSDSTEIGKDKANKLGGASELISVPDTSEPCESNSFVEDRMVVSEVSSDRLGNELERQRVSSPLCLDDRDNKQEADSGVIVDLKSPGHMLSSTVVNASLSSFGNSCSGLSSSTENKHIPLGKPHASPLCMDDHQASSNSSLQNTVASDIQCGKTASQDRLSSTCDIQVSTDDKPPITGNSTDHVDARSILQGYPLQAPIKEINGEMNSSSSATELHLLSQKNEQPDDQIKKLQQPDDQTKKLQSSDSDKTSRNGDVKLFGKILTNPSAQKPNVCAKGSEENGTHHPKFSKPSSMKFTGHSADANLKILKFDCNDYVGLENVPMRSYGYWDGSRIQTGLSSLPDSAILLAKYPAAFSNYPTSSAKLEQPSLQTFSKNNERLLNGSNAVIDYQMFRRDGPKVQPFMVDVKHCQDVFSEMQRRNGFEAISSLQQQSRGVMGMNGVGRPGILVGGSCSGVSDPVAAIKMHYSNSEKYGGQSGSITREDESWGGKGD